MKGISEELEEMRWRDYKGGMLGLVQCSVSLYQFCCALMGKSTTPKKFHHHTGGRISSTETHYRGNPKKRNCGDLCLHSSF
jgi:hypothetical protein